MKTDNEKIAEFMGWEKYSGNSYKCPNIYPIENTTSMGWTTFRADQLEFSSRWDWLMPVVEKIKQLRDFDTVTDGKHNRDPYFATRVADLLGILTTVDIKVVHLAVVAFIDWYSTSQTLKK